MFGKYNKSVINLSTNFLCYFSKKITFTFTTRHLNTSSKISPKPIIKKKFPSPHDLGMVKRK